MQKTTIQEYNISKLTLGTVQFGLNYNIHNLSKPDARQSIEILEYACNAGINTFDTARIYGDAEQIVGDFLTREFRKEINIVSKFKISPENIHHIDKARAEVYESVNASISALGINCIPICLFHQGKDQPLELLMEILPGILTDLIDDGLINTGGISVYHPDEVKYTLDNDVIKAIQAPMNIFDQRLKQSGLLQKMYSHKKIIFIRSIFLKGLFFMPLKRLRGNLIEAGKYLQILRKLAKQTDVSVAQLAFSYVRDIDEVTSIVFGADNMEQVQQNIKLLQSAKLHAEIHETIEEEFQNIPETIITPHLWTL